MQNSPLPAVYNHRILLCVWFVCCSGSGMLFVLTSNNQSVLLLVSCKLRFLPESPSGSRKEKKSKRKIIIGITRHGFHWPLSIWKSSTLMMPSFVSLVFFSRLQFWFEMFHSNIVFELNSCSLMLKFMGCSLLYNSYCHYFFHFFLNWGSRNMDKKDGTAWAWESGCTATSRLRLLRFDSRKWAWVQSLVEVSFQCK